MSFESARPMAESHRQPYLPPIAWPLTLALFGAPAVALYVATRIAIPNVAEATGWEPIIWWFLLGGLGVFVPLLVIALLLLRGEALDGIDIWRNRLRFHRMRASDWRWALGGLVVIGALSALIQFAVLPLLFTEVSVHPPFMAFEPLGPGRYWILAAWLPFWLLNIFGEEILWRGVILPRQEAAFGARAWVANAAGWALFHVAFGVQLMLMLLPIIVLLPWITQRCRNSWVAVVIHGGLNGPGFVAIALGVV